VMTLLVGMDPSFMVLFLRGLEAPAVMLAAVRIGER
jgi:hypothetical protein